MTTTAKLMHRVLVFLVKVNVLMKMVNKPVQNAKVLMANAHLWHVALPTRAPSRRLVAGGKNVRQITVVDAMPLAAPRRDHQWMIVLQTLLTVGELFIVITVAFISLAAKGTKKAREEAVAEVLPFAHTAKIRLFKLMVQH